MEEKGMDSKSDSLASLLQWFYALPAQYQHQILTRQYNLYLHLSISHQFSSPQPYPQQQEEMLEYPVEEIHLERQGENEEEAERKALIEEGHVLADEMDRAFKDERFDPGKKECECCHGFITSCDGEACIPNELCICSQ